MQILDPKFPKQTSAVLDSSRFKAYNCGRRSGKTIGLAKEYIQTAYAKPNSKMIYFALTGQSAYDIIWSEILDECDRNLIPTKPNKVERRIYFPEVKSSLKIAGADASEREIKKVLGQKYSMAGIDECGSFTIDMHKFVYQMIRPALVDLQGNLVLIGTCENIPNTFFEKVCNGTIAGWSLHRWTAYDNPYVAANWDCEIKDLLADNPKAIEASWFRTHYLNEWVTDTDKLIIPLKKEYFIQEIPQERTQDYYVLGVDLGSNDASSFTLLSYSKHHKSIIVRFSYKKPDMDFTDVTDFIKKLQNDYPIHKIIIDGSNKQGVEEMRRRKGLSLHAAEKIDKAIHLRMLKDDYIQGNIVIYEPDCGPLILECSHLIWYDEMKNKEDPRCENHCNDSHLYAWRECKHYSYEPINKLDPNKNEYMDAYERQQAEDLAQQIEEEEQGFL